MKAKIEIGMGNAAEGAEIRIDPGFFPDFCCADRYDMI